ncbi:MAG: TatD family hydrolase [Caldilineaceae bacterium]|nr:TatD family hydrolase [Caldilineaceae bacterium]
MSELMALPKIDQTDELMLFDTHCHLDVSHFAEDRIAVMERARQAGVRHLVIPGIDLEHCRAGIALAEEYAHLAEYPHIYAAVGIHPNSSDGLGQKALTRLREMASHPRVVAIGEIGLDYYWDKVEPARQKEAFQAQLELAADVGLPVIIHSRESNTDVADMLEQWVASPAFRQSQLAERPFAGVLHAFSGDLALAQRAYDWPFVISLGGPVTFKNAHALQTLAPQLRLDRLMLETDAPYLTPHPHRGKRNEPAYVALVCHKLAELFEMSAPALAEATTNVALQFFQIQA